MTGAGRGRGLLHQRSHGKSDLGIHSRNVGAPQHQLVDYVDRTAMRRPEQGTPSVLWTSQTQT